MRVRWFRHSGSTVLRIGKRHGRYITEAVRMTDCITITQNIAPAKRLSFSELTHGPHAAVTGWEKCHSGT